MEDFINIYSIYLSTVRNESVEILSFMCIMTVQG